MSTLDRYAAIFSTARACIREGLVPATRRAGEAGCPLQRGTGRCWKDLRVRINHRAPGSRAMVWTHAG
jgi:hypothetical protein